MELRSDMMWSLPISSAAAIILEFTNQFTPAR
jgi:hypothetical protein